MTILPVWPICWAYGIQPASTAARVAPTAPPSASAMSSTSLKPSGPPTPRPPATMIRASSIEAAAPAAVDPLDDGDRGRRELAVGCGVSTDPADAAGSAVDAFGPDGDDPAVRR